MLVISLALVLTGCKKTSVVLPKQYDGVITGYDMRKCASPACGGLFITLKKDTAQNPPPYYRTNQTLTQLGISENTRFPIYVDLSYRPDTGIFKAYNYIVVTSIEVVQ